MMADASRALGNIKFEPFVAFNHFSAAAVNFSAKKLSHSINKVNIAVDASLTVTPLQTHTHTNGEMEVKPTIRHRCVAIMRFISNN